MKLLISIAISTLLVFAPASASQTLENQMCDFMAEFAITTAQLMRVTGDSEYATSWIPAGGDDDAMWAATWGLRLVDKTDAAIYKRVFYKCLSTGRGLVN